MGTNCTHLTKHESFRPWLLLLVSLLIPGVTTAAQWQPLRPGLNYQKILPNPALPWRKLHIFQLDPLHYDLQLNLARDDQKTRDTVQGFFKRHPALLLINGGFFTPEGAPLGLRISAGKTLQSLHPTSWWGVFYIVHNQPHLSAPEDFIANSDIQFAIQSGPRLIVNGKIPALKAGSNERSAIGITAENKLILVVTEYNAVSTTELAHFMRDALGCRFALNLDGGRSSQLYAQIGDWHLNIPGATAVSDVIRITPKPHTLSATSSP